MSGKPFLVRAPGRVCLFGEHSDYLGLDVIAAAIDLEIEIMATPLEEDTIHIMYPNIREYDEFSLDLEIEYRNNRDYIRSSFNVMARKGFRPKHGWSLLISGNIPIAAGLSSSSAMTVASVMAIAEMAGSAMPKEEVALTAYESEVVEFGESGGTMDHFASVMGGVIHVNMGTQEITPLPAQLDSFVIGNSGEKKDTVGDLRFIRTTVEREYEEIAKRISSFDRRTTPTNLVYELSQGTPSRERRMAEATLRNRDLTNRAFELLKDVNPDPVLVGNMIHEHHEILRDDLERSTPKIESLIDAALSAGAVGCKINGSGGGGSMMAYTAGQNTIVASAIENAGATAHIVKVGEGAILSRVE